MVARAECIRWEKHQRKSIDLKEHKRYTNASIIIHFIGKTRTSDENMYAGTSELFQ